MTNQKDIAKKQAEIAGKLQQFPIGRSNSGGRAGGTVEVIITNPLPGQPSVVQAKCANDCPPGDVQIIKADDGSYVALSPNAARVTSESESKSYSKKTLQQRKPKVLENIKILFYVDSEIADFSINSNLRDRGIVERLWKELWIGGTWPVKKIYTTPPGYRLADAFIVNTGEKEEDYVVMGRLFPIEKIHLSFNRVSTDMTAILGSTAAIFFVIENGTTSSQEFTQESCPPYYWRYCGGGFFYSTGSRLGVNTIWLENRNDNYTQQAQFFCSGWLWPSSWTRTYHWYSGTPHNYKNMETQLYANGEYSSTSVYDFVGIATESTIMYGGSISLYSIDINAGIYEIKPSNTYTLLPAWFSSVEPAIFGADVSSSWYFKSKIINSQPINTFFFASDGRYVESPYEWGFAGDYCVTPYKNFSIDYRKSVEFGLEFRFYGIVSSEGYVYEPLIVNNEGTKTLVIKQMAARMWTDRNYPVFLMYLSEDGESSAFTSITGIPELNNFSFLGIEYVKINKDGGVQTVNTIDRPAIYSYFASIWTTGQSYSYYPTVIDCQNFDSNNYYAPTWENTLDCTLKTYWYNGSTDLVPFSLSSNQSEANKEILYLKDFLLSFARFVGLNILPSEDVRYTIDAGRVHCKYFKPLSSYIKDSIYILYGFTDTNNVFFGSQGVSFAEPEKTRSLPQTNKATAKVVELTLDEFPGQIKVEPRVKSLPIYMVTPENAGSPTIALASATYWSKGRTKGIPMPVFTPTPSEVAAPPTPTPTPSPSPTPTPPPDDGIGY